MSSKKLATQLSAAVSAVIIPTFLNSDSESENECGDIYKELVFHPVLNMGRNLVNKSVLNEFQPASIQSSPSLYHLVAYVIQHKPQQQQPLPLTTLQNFGCKQNLSIDFSYFSDLCSPRSSGLSSMSQTSPQLDENIWGDSLIWAAPSIDNKKYSMMEEWSGDFNNNRSKSAVRLPPGFNQFSDE